MNFNKLCSDLLKLNSKIRFIGVLNSRGDLIVQKIRKDSTSLLSVDEFKMLIYYITNRRNRLQNLQHKLGTVSETITKYENTNTISIFLDKNIIFISTDPNSNVSKITSDVWKIIYKKSVKKTGSKKKSIPRKSKKKSIPRKSKKKSIPRKSKKENISKLKPKLDRLEKRVNSLYKKHKKLN